MEVAKRVVKNTGILYVQMGITVFISLYTTRLVLAALGVNDFGIFNVVGGAISMLVFLNTALTAATQRFMSYARGEGAVDKQTSIFNISLVLHFIIGLIIVLILELAGYFLFDSVLNINPNRIETAKLIYQFLIVSTFFTIVSVPYDAVINAHENMLLVAILRIIETILKLVIAIFITFYGFDKLSMYGFLMASIAILLLFVRIFYCHIKYSEVIINMRRFYKRQLFIEMTSFAGWSLLGSSTSIVAFYGQGVVLNMFFGTLVNAAQGVANQISGQLGAFSVSMLKALNPIIAKSEGAGDRQLMLKAALTGGKFSYFLLLLFYIPVFIEMPFIFNFWLKEVPEYAIIFCRLLLIKNLIEQFYLTLATSISAVGKIKKYQLIISILNLSPLIVTYILFKLGMQPQILYVSFIGYALICLVINIHFSRKLCDLPVKFFLNNNISRCLISTFFIFVLSTIPNQVLDESFVRLVLVSIMSFLTFLIVVYWIGLSISEKKFIEENLSNLLRSIKIKYLNKTR